MKRSDKVIGCKYISIRLQNICRFNGIITVGELLSMYDEYLLTLNGFGITCMHEVQNLRKSVIESTGTEGSSVVEFDQRITVDLDSVLHLMDPSSRRRFILSHICDLENDDIIKEYYNRKLNS